MDPLIVLAATLVLLSAALTTMGFRSIAGAESQRISSRLTRPGTNQRSAGAVSVTVQQTSRGVYASLDGSLTKLSWAQRMQMNLKRAEVNLHVSEFVFLRLLIAIGGGLAIAFIGGSFVATIAGAIVALMSWLFAGRWVA